MILRPYERAIFKRYLLPQRGEGFIFVAAAFSFTAVMLGVAALVIVMSVMNGVRSDLFDKIVGLNGHAVVQGFGGRLDDWRDLLKEVKATPGVVSATPLIEQPLLTTFNGRVEGSRVDDHDHQPRRSVDAVRNRAARNCLSRVGDLRDRRL